MSNGEERLMRQQLVEARAKIAAQLQKLYSPTDNRGTWMAPDCRDVIAELESELREIDALLGVGEQ